MWTISPTGDTRQGRGGDDGTPWSTILLRLRAASPWGFWAAAATTYVLALLVGLALTPTGAPYPLADPAPGVAALWLSSYSHQPRWWRDRAARAAAATILLAGPALFAGAGADPVLALSHGPTTLAVAATTIAIWTLLLRPGRGAMAGIWRLLLTAGAAGGLTLFVVPLVAPAGPGGLPPVWLAWLIRATAGVFVPVLIGHALLAPASGVLRRARLSQLLPLLAATAVGGGVEVLADQRLYLMIPLVVWAAAALTERGAAAYALVALAVVLRGAAGDAGPFALGGMTDRTLTVNTVALVLVGVAMTLARTRAERAVLLAEVTARSREAVEQAHLFTTMIAATQEAVVTLDDAARAVVVNDAARALADQCGSTVEALVEVAGEDRLAAVLTAGESVVTDITVPAAVGGAQRVLALRAYPMRHHGVAGAVVFLADVTTERRRTEGLRSFARTVAHDLRNPLSGIRLSSELAASALDVGDTDEAAAMMAAIAATGDRAAQILRDVADYSLAGDAELASEPLLLSEFVARIARQRAADPTTSSPELTIDADVWAQADARLLARVVDNLLGNAVKYCAPGTLAQVEIVARETDDGRVAVVVADRGIGVPDGQEQRIFEAFHRAPQHATAYAGTGLGLAICRQVIERHGGTISARRRPGGGTVFRFSLPAAAARPVRTPCAEPALAH